LRNAVKQLEGKGNSSGTRILRQGANTGNIFI